MNDWAIFACLLQTFLKEMVQSKLYNLMFWI